MDYPEYLYHYTNLESLALILQNKSFRFMSLSNLDDLQEGKSKDNAHYEDFIFVSSWTEDEQESIPMWKMYTSPYAGVRIKLPVNPFEKTYIDFGDEPYFMATSHKEKFAEKVGYTEDRELLEPKVLQKFKNGYVHFTPKLGRYKSTAWSFQNEWRYIEYFNPININDVGKPDAFKIVSERFLQKNYLPFSYIDLPLKKDIFSKMVLTLSPWFKQGNKVILNCLQENYAPEVIIEESQLFGKLK